MVHGKCNYLVALKYRAKSRLEIFPMEPALAFGSVLRIETLLLELNQFLFHELEVTFWISKIVAEVKMSFSSHFHNLTAL